MLALGITEAVTESMLLDRIHACALSGCHLMPSFANRITINSTTTLQVSILGVCIEVEPFYMVLEYLPGGSLEGWLGKHHADCKLTHRAAILYQIAIGMVRLGEVGVVHRDLVR
jgi:serine/threonine protein kinase